MQPYCLLPLYDFHRPRDIKLLTFSSIKLAQIENNCRKIMKIGERCGFVKNQLCSFGLIFEMDSSKLLQQITSKTNTLEMFMEKRKNSHAMYATQHLQESFN